jgi:predicted GNAT family acetyltransferase
MPNWIDTILWSAGDAFVQRARPVLLEREATNCVMLGIAGNAPGDADELRVTGERNGRVEVVGIRTPRRHLLLSHGSDEAARAVAEALSERGHTVPGVGGPRETAEAFARRWGEVAGVEVRLRVALRVFQVERVEWPAPRAEGSLALAGDGDLGLMAGWIEAFARTIGEPTEDPMGDARRVVGEGRAYLWNVDGWAVSKAVRIGPTENGIRIGGVFTPPEERGKGYATACVAALSQTLLDEGRKFCFLNADVANPVANRIYERIGYRAVSDWVVWRFG